MLEITDKVIMEKKRARVVWHQEMHKDFQKLPEFLF